MCIQLVWGLKKKTGKTMGKMIEDADKVLDAMDDVESDEVEAETKDDLLAELLEVIRGYRDDSRSENIFFSMGASAASMSHLCQILDKMEEM